MPDQSSDAERLVQWVREHGGAVRGYLLALVRRRETADDLAQDVFRRAWQARDRYEDRGTPRAYLLRIADRLVCDWARRPDSGVQLSDEGWRHVEPVDALPDPPARLEDQELGEQLRLALDGLSPAQRRVLLLRFYGDLEFAEIAAQLDCPLGTVLSHCHRGLQALRQRLAGRW